MNAALARRGDVDAVVADAEHRDDFERRQLHDQLPRHLRIAGRGNRPDARRRRREPGKVGEVRAVVDRERRTQRLEHRRPELGDGQHLGGAVGGPVVGSHREPF
jgi:hypothetical protein